MKIEHVSMYVSDLEGMKDFYCNFFHAKSNELEYNPKTKMKTYFLTFDKGVKLELLYQVERQFDIHKQIRTGYSHLTFQVESKEEVDLLTKRIKKAKFELLSGPINTKEGHYECCIKDPEWNQIEVFA